MENSLESKISALILDWRLNDALNLLHEAAQHLGSEKIETLHSLLNVYQNWERMFSDIRVKIETDPEAAYFIFEQIPEDIRQSYPTAESLSAEISYSCERYSAQSARKKADQATRLLTDDLNIPQAAQLLQSAKETYPNWQTQPGLRDSIETAAELLKRLSRGIEIQKEISSLREKGGASAYLRSLSLLNEYAAQNLEEFGISLFNVNTERENLLRTLSHAEGESWAHRLTSGQNEDILRLEQSIRSLTDAEYKNLRVLYNNNSKLLILLIHEQERQPSESETRYFAERRINELREHNQHIQTEFMTEIAKRATEYCTMAENSVQIGEITQAESNLLLAKDAGKPADLYHDDEYLGEVVLPDEILDRVKRIEELIRSTQKIRYQATEDLRQVRETLKAGNQADIFTLQEMAIRLENIATCDPFLPGLQSEICELQDRNRLTKTFVFEKTFREMDNDLHFGRINCAEDALNSILPLFRTENEKNTLYDQLHKIDLFRTGTERIKAIQAQTESIYQKICTQLTCENTQLSTLEILFSEVDGIRTELGLPTEISSAEKESVFSIVRAIFDCSAWIMQIRLSLSKDEFSAQSVQSAENLETSVLFQLPDTKILLARFFMQYAGTKTNADEKDRLFIKAEQIAVASENTDLCGEIRASYSAHRIKTDLEKRKDFLFDTLTTYFNEKEIISAIEFIAKHVTNSDRADAQIGITVDKIERAYRVEQAEILLRSAQEFLAAQELEEAEATVAQSLDFFFTIEAAQTKKLIETRQMRLAKIMRDADAFLQKTFPDLSAISESDVELIHLAQANLNILENDNALSQNIQAKLMILRRRLEKILSTEESDFANALRHAEQSLNRSAVGIPQAFEIIRKLEERNWVESRSAEISAIKFRTSEIGGFFTALEAAIHQADAYVQIGDPRSATKILSSFSAENMQGWPNWLNILHESAGIQVQTQSMKYETVRLRFSPQTGKPTIQAGITEILNSNTADYSQIGRYQIELDQLRSVLEQEIHVDSAKNICSQQIAYLSQVLYWMEQTNRILFSDSTPYADLSIESLYAIRKTGREIYERIPPSLSELQPRITERNRWLEKRTKVRQTLTQGRRLLRTDKTLSTSGKRAILNDLRIINKNTLMPAEQVEVDQILNHLKRHKIRKVYLFSVLAVFLALIGGLYTASPWLIAALTPAPTQSATITETMPATNTALPSTTPTLTGTPTRTPTATATATPQPLTAEVRSNIIAVYELPTGNSKSLSDGYLLRGTQVQVIRFCESATLRGEIWGLIPHASSERNTGWILLNRPNAGGETAIFPAEQNKSTLEVFERNPSLKITCPTRTSDFMPGEEVLQNSE